MASPRAKVADTLTAMTLIMIMPILENKDIGCSSQPLLRLRIRFEIESPTGYKQTGKQSHGNGHIRQS